MNVHATRIIKILEYYKIEYSVGGKNVSSNRCVGVRCPFCGDKGFHGGIFVDGANNFTCWKCKTNVSMYKFVNENVHVSYDDYERVTRTSRFNRSTAKPLKTVSAPVFVPKHVDFPPAYVAITTGAIPELVKAFLFSRKYTVNDCIKYRAGYCMYGKYAHRFIVPVFYDGMLVAFQGRDMTGKASFKYRSSEIALNPLNMFLYAYDDCGDSTILVEGVFDQWRLGDGVVATFGASLTARQRRLILDKNLNELIFAWERNMYNKAKAAAKTLKPFIENIKVLLLPCKGDPDTLGSAYIYDNIQNSVYI